MFENGFTSVKSRLCAFFSLPAEERPRKSQLFSCSRLTSPLALLYQIDNLLNPSTSLEMDTFWFVPAQLWNENQAILEKRLTSPRRPRPALSDQQFVDKASPASIRIRRASGDRPTRRRWNSQVGGKLSLISSDDANGLNSGISLLLNFSDFILGRNTALDLLEWIARGIKILPLNHTIDIRQIDVSK